MSGDADVPFWPSARGAGAGFRGGNWFDARARARASDLRPDAPARVVVCDARARARASDRFWAAIPSIDRMKSHGGRAVRTAPAVP
jgi:hypothetical protein